VWYAITEAPIRKRLNPRKLFCWFTMAITLAQIAAKANIDDIWIKLGNSHPRRIQGLVTRAGKVYGKVDGGAEQELTWAIKSWRRAAEAEFRTSLDSPRAQAADPTDAWPPFARLQQIALNSSINELCQGSLTAGELATARGIVWEVVAQTEKVQTEPGTPEERDELLTRWWRDGNGERDRLVRQIILSEYLPNRKSKLGHTRTTAEDESGRDDNTTTGSTLYEPGKTDDVGPLAKTSIVTLHLHWSGSPVPHTLHATATADPTIPSWSAVIISVKKWEPFTLASCPPRIVIDKITKGKTTLADVEDLPDPSLSELVVEVADTYFEPLRSKGVDHVMTIVAGACEGFRGVEYHELRDTLFNLLNRDSLVAADVRVLQRKINQLRIASAKGVSWETRRQLAHEQYAVYTDNLSIKLRPSRASSHFPRNGGGYGNSSTTPTNPNPRGGVQYPPPVLHDAPTPGAPQCKFCHKYVALGVGGWEAHKRANCNTSFRN
jgi:hypothetical protein